MSGSSQVIPGTEMNQPSKILREPKGRREIWLYNAGDKQQENATDRCPRPIRCPVGE